MRAVDRKRKIIGLLVSGITDTFSIQLIRGVVRAAKVRGLDVVIFPGKYLDRDLSDRTEIMYEYQFATLFSYANKYTVDGLVISANSIGCHTNEARMHQFVNEYSDIPSVLVATRFEGHTCICYDNMNAVIEGVDYLIKQEGCRKVCELAGPECNTDAIERHDAYAQTLEKNGLKFDPRMSENGDFMDSDETREAMEKLIFQNPDMDAVFCHNDNMAMVAYDVIRKHDLEPGIDIKVLGYDNIRESASLDPPLATISADPILLGEKAIECLIDKMNGRKIGDTTLPAKLIGRESLGPKYAEERRHLITDEMTLREDFAEIYYRYINEKSPEETEEIYQKFEVVMRAVLRSLGKMLDLSVTSEEILRKFDDLIKSDALSYMDTEAMLRFIDRQGTRSAEVRSLDLESAMKSRAIVAEIYKRLIQATEKRMNAMAHHKVRIDSETKNFVKESMGFRHGIDQSYQVLLEHLEWAGINSGCLYIFDNPIIHLEGERFFPPESSNIKAYVRDGKVNIPITGRQKRKLKDGLIPDELGDKPNYMLIAPLFFTEELYGLFMCNMSESIFSEGEFIINQLGAATRMLDILRENEENRQRLEDNLMVVSKMNVELDTMSRSDPLTGLLNRRGFTDAATDFLNRSIQSANPCIVGYVDMNNLKVVNDRFGHEEGDFSLKSIATIMCSVMSGGRSVVGRIGGDEFAFITVGYTKEADELEEKIKTGFTSFNQSTDKPYNVTASIGMYPVKGGDHISLEDALSYADEALYVAKQTKDRNILKNVKG
ncbi:MAG: GGDEF domain-containing protein [Lachnospiraceae bacterium]|nr:GGDEF domain-containing protein [Lachnospiraceae bacterium]